MLRLTFPSAPAARLALACLGALALAGCGVKGPLELPPGAQAAAPSTGKSVQVAAPVVAPAADASGIAAPLNPAKAASASTEAGWAASSTSKRSNPLTGAQRPNQPFILDGLL